MRKALSEAVALGAAKVNSPVSFPQSMREWIAPFETELKEFYEAHCQGMKGDDLTLAIEKHFGERMLFKVPRELIDGGYLWVAAQVASGGHLDIPHERQKENVPQPFDETMRMLE